MTAVAAGSPAAPPTAPWALTLRRFLADRIGLLAAVGFALVIIGSFAGGPIVDLLYAAADPRIGPGVLAAPSQQVPRHGLQPGS